MSPMHDLLLGMAVLYVMYGAIIGTAIVLTGESKTSFWSTAITFYLFVIGWPLIMGLHRTKGLGGRDE